MIKAIERISAIILAAGLSSRMGQNKLLLDFRGKPILSHTLALVESLPFGEKILVITSDTAANLKIPDCFTVVINRNQEKGQSYSMRLGLTKSAGDYYMFFLGDTPLIDEETVKSLVSHIEDDKIIIPKTVRGPANPVIFPKRYRDELAQVRGDTGGRAVIRNHADQCKKININAENIFFDIDTPDDYDSLT